MNKKTGVHELQIGGKKHYLKFSVNTFIRIKEDLGGLDSKYIESLKRGDLETFCHLIRASYNEATRLGFNKSYLKDKWEAGDILDEIGMEGLQGVTETMYQSRFLSQGLEKTEKQNPAPSEKKTSKKQSSK